MELFIRNVNQALYEGIAVLIEFPDAAIDIPSRAGDVKEFREPFMTHYEKPQERVLLSATRDANPVFHLFETLWLLAGRRDVKFLVEMNKRMAEYSDDGKFMQGAYGWRWRHGFYADQVAELVAHLRDQPESRRAVLAMWDPNRDLWGLEPVPNLTVGGIKSKDIPCNTHAYFKVREGRLNITVCCRSNDMLWGAYGANAVHFSMLQEYVADKLGVLIGRYTQVSDSLHVYTGGPGGDIWERLKAEYEAGLRYKEPYEGLTALPLGVNETWDGDLRLFFHRYDAGLTVEPKMFAHSWWAGTAVPMWNAWKQRDPAIAATIIAPDWRKAVVEWIYRHPGKGKAPVGSAFPWGEGGSL